MTTGDFDRFLLEFQRMSAALSGFKASVLEVKTKADAYFHVLKKYPITDVIAKADQWLATESKMPKPAEWAGVLVVKRVELPAMTQFEADTYARAERLRYEDDPCPCHECQAAGVSDKPLRFVPECDAHDRDRKMRMGDKIVTAGHWAHGWELARYYTARADFWNGCYERWETLEAEDKKRRKQPFGQRLDGILKAALKVMRKRKQADVLESELVP